MTAGHIEGHAQGEEPRPGAASCPATWCGSTPAGARTGKRGEEGGPYYAMAPGLSVDAAKLLAKKRIVAIGFDAPFIDPVPSGMLQGKASPAPGHRAGAAVLGAPLHVVGIRHSPPGGPEISSAMADEHVWTSCAMVLPSRDKGAAGAVIRPVGGWTSGTALRHRCWTPVAGSFRSRSRRLLVHSRNSYAARREMRTRGCGKAVSGPRS